MPTNTLKLAFNTENVAYDSIQNKTYTVSNITSVIDPTYGIVAKFAGNNSLLTIPGTSVRPELYGRTKYYFISAWVRVESGNIALLHRIGNNQNLTNVVLRFGSISFIAYFNATSSNKDLAFDDGKWHHVAMSRNAAVWKLYVDGTVILQKNSSNYTTVQTNQHIGKFNGNILDYRVYNGPNVDSDILELYNNGPDTIIPSNAEILSITPMSSTVVVKVDNPSGLSLVLEVDGNDYTMQSDEIVIRDLDPGIQHEMVLKH